MNRKNLLRQIPGLMWIAVLLTGCGGAPAQPGATSISSTATFTPVPAPSLTPLPTAIPGYQDPIQADGFEFNIAEAKVTATVQILSTTETGVSIYKGDLVGTTQGDVAQNAAPDDQYLIVRIKLQAGNRQKFLDTDLKLIEGDVQKSAVAIFTEDQDTGVIWIYEIAPVSRPLVIVFPDGVSIDLKPVMHMLPPGQF